MQKKIITAIILNVIVICATLGIISYFAVRNNIRLSLQNRLALARIISNHIEVLLNNNLNRLYEASLSGQIDLKDKGLQTNKGILEKIYKYSLFTEGIFLLDEHGNELLTYPPRYEYFSNLTYINDVNEVLRYGRPLISNIYTIEPVKKKVIFMMVPLKDGKGKVSGILGGILGPTEHFISTLLQSSKVGSNSYIEVIDSNEMVVASDNPSLVFQHHTHDGVLSRMIMEGKSGIMECRHGFSNPNAEVRPVDQLAFVPLNVAKWGVIVAQDENELFAPARALKTKFLLLVLVFICTSVVFSIAMSKNIVKPLGSLIASTKKIASGDLSTPVGDQGSDEILMLSRSFDDMRKKLAKSLESIKTYNAKLESRVTERTRQIRESGQKIEDLLKKVISSQEDERRRVARGLHDTVLQDISAALIKMDICKLNPEIITIGKIDEMRELMVKTIDSVHTVIKDLRPSILDDLGITAGIQWLLDKHLKDNGITCYLDIESPIRGRLSPWMEITLFRILQESIGNIARHANAESVFVTLDAGASWLLIIVEDDGDGFDLNELMRHRVENGRGLGIIGMRERASLLDGIFQMHSMPGEGTRMCLQIPLPKEEHV